MWTGKQIKKRNSIIIAIFSALAGGVTILFENMGVIGIDFSSRIFTRFCCSSWNLNLSVYFL